ncbi:hypothetical protein [Sorangium sp. So ce1078]|uniref:hypothetical protein n=1 Tax=Sorangium sp. So ce1078 TaxID=3133329 RepID=UPI003F5E3C6C
MPPAGVHVDDADSSWRPGLPSTFDYSLREVTAVVERRSVAISCKKSRCKLDDLAALAAVAACSARRYARAMHARPHARRAAGLAVAAVLACVPGAARADSEPLEGLDTALIGAGLSVLPSELGAEVAAGGDAVGGPRALVLWAFQIPVGSSRPEGRTAVLSNHRVALALGLALGGQRGATDDARTDTTFRMRAGYRGVHHPRGGWFGALAGLGTTVEFWPVVRPSISPEIGLHLGACCENDVTAVGTLVFRLDRWFAGNDALRLSATLGWALF